MLAEAGGGGRGVNVSVCWRLDVAVAGVAGRSSERAGGHKVQVLVFETSVANCFANFHQSSPSSDAAACAPRCLLMERFT